MMAEQGTQPEQHNNSGEEAKFNRQINYFIMRYMWQVICGRNPNDTIYMAFNTSRERYTRIINTGMVRYAKNELDSLSQITGLSKEIFSGEKRFKCLYEVDKKEPQEKPTTEKKQKPGEEQVPEKETIDITEQQWQNLFQWRKSRAGKKGQLSPQDEIYHLLRQVKRSDPDNWDFYRLCYFLRERTPAPIKVTKEQFRDMVNAISHLSFSILDKCEVAQLKHLQKLLKEKSTLVSAIIIYKNSKDN